MVFKSFSKDMTLMAKGLAILLMVVHHLFAFPSRIQSVNYQALFMVNGDSVEFLVGSFGKICVAMFLFLSGYGLFEKFKIKGTYIWSDSKKRIIHFLKIYWLVFLLFIPLGLIFFNERVNYHWDIKTLLYNLFLLDSTYNGEWWFASLYVELLFITPILIKIINKSALLSSYISFIAVFFSGFFQGAIKYFPNHELIQLALNHISVLLAWQIVFIFGILFSKYSIFNKINRIFQKYHLDNKMTYLIIILASIYFRQDLLHAIIRIRGSQSFNVYNFFDFLIAPLIIFSFVKIIYNIKNAKYVFMILGKHSNNIWLTHSFFIFYYFQNLTFAPEISVLIVIWLFIITILVSKFINRVLDAKYGILDYANIVLPLKRKKVI